MGPFAFVMQMCPWKSSKLVLKSNVWSFRIRENKICYITDVGSYFLKKVYTNTIWHYDLCCLGFLFPLRGGFLCVQDRSISLWYGNYSKYVYNMPIHLSSILVFHIPVSFLKHKTACKVAFVRTSKNVRPLAFMSQEKLIDF